jgi:hypothetical protein
MISASVTATATTRDWNDQKVSVSTMVRIHLAWELSSTFLGLIRAEAGARVGGPGLGESLRLLSLSAAAAAAAACDARVVRRPMMVGRLAVLGLLDRGGSGRSWECSGLRIYWR